MTKSKVKYIMLCAIAALTMLIMGVVLSTNNKATSAYADSADYEDIFNYAVVTAADGEQSYSVSIKAAERRREILGARQTAAKTET